MPAIVLATTPHALITLFSRFTIATWSFSSDSLPFLQSSNGLHLKNLFTTLTGIDNASVSDVWE
ncbi:hypothetical protein [Nitrosomonas supralitoralis]|uniref:hypothetical protein n=1 Tax=Nitrosomonas supralitoralis TaxID=2116706 RepID=UPI00155882E6|nr:hypothetical protein [Nitrosomonas supralitoralis]